MALGLARGLTQTRGPEESRYLYGRSRGGTSFDGANDYSYKAVAGSNFGDDEDKSSVNIIVATIKADNLSNNDTICYFADSTVGDTLQLGFVCGGGYIQFAVYNNNDAASDTITGVRSTSTASNSTWYHLVGQRVWNDTLGTESKTFYINGVKQSGSFDDSNVTFPALKSGAARDGDGSGSLGTDYWGGDMQELGHLYYLGTDAVLNTKKVLSLYNNGHPRNPKSIGPRVATSALGSFIQTEGLFDYYTFDNVTATISSDYGGIYVFDRADVAPHTSDPGIYKRLPTYGATKYASGDTNMNGTLVG